MAWRPDLETWFGWSWRLAILALPWQTRFIVPATETVAVWREQWNNAIYVSWAPMLAAVVLGLMIRKPKHPTLPNAVVLWMTLAALVALSFASTFPPGTFQWWLQVAWLGAFGAVLVRNAVDARALAGWFAASLIPHALLALEQLMSQRVFASTMLGIAGQLPETRGVSVVEAGGARLLRAYGGFPYPNILGGWLALGIPAAAWLAATSIVHRSSFIVHRYFWILVTGLLSAGLIASFSRSAWLALIVFGMIGAWRVAKLSKTVRASWAKPVAAILLGAGLVLAWQWPAIVTRATAEGRLEVRSMSERGSGFADGIGAFLANPVFGVGRNAFGWSFDGYALPHNVFVLSLAETGVVGTVGHVILFMLLWSSLRFNRRLFWLLAPALFILANLDHYLWSYWPGQSLAMLSVVFLMLPGEKVREH